MIGECARCGQNTTVPTLKAVLRWHRQHPCSPAAAPEAASAQPATATAATTTFAPTSEPAERPVASPTAPAPATSQAGARAVTTTSTGQASNPAPAPPGRAATVTPRLMPEKRILSYEPPPSSSSSDWDAYAQTAVDWRDDALCAQVGADIFFPDKGESTRAAKATCARCPVTAQCLRYALDHGERFGVWGGLSERQRRRLTAQQKAAA